ncbi:MAG: hypothetical protein WD875_01270 [Pirellulales bacterium]
MITKFRTSLAYRAIGLALLWLALGAVTARAADVLNHVPDTALAVVVVNNAEKGSEKVDRLAAQLMLPTPSVLNLLTGRANIEKGLKTDGPAAAIVFAPRDGRSAPRGMLLLPTDDYDALIAQLDPDDTKDKKTPLTLADKLMVAAKVGDYAAFVEPRDEALLDDVLSGKTSIGSQVGDMAKWLDAQDAYALATSSGIAMAAEKILEAMEQAKDQFDNLGTEEQVETIKMVFAMYGDLFKTAKSELAFAALGVRGEDKGLHMTSRMAFKSGSAADKFAATVSAPKQKLLSGLPSGDFVFAGGAEFSAKSMKYFYDWSAKMMRSMPGGKDLKQEDIDTLMKLSAEQMAGLKSASFAMYVPEADAALYESIVAVMNVKDSAAFMSSYANSIEAMTALAKKVKSPFLTEGSVEKTKIDGKAALELTLKMPAAAGDPTTAELMKKMFGNAENIKAYIVAIDAKTVALGYVSPDAVRRAMKAAGGKGIAANTNVMKAAELLPEGCQVVSFLSPKGLIDMVIRLVPGVEFSPVPALVGDFPNTPPIGFGIKVSASGVETDMVVPEETLEAIGTTIARARAVSFESR